MAIGSLGWGTVAQHWGSALALTAAAAGTVLAALFAMHFKLGEAARVNVTPSGHWPQPVVAMNKSEVRQARSARRTPP